MSESFVLRQQGLPLASDPVVVVTGAAGLIGRSFVDYAADRYRLRLLVRSQADDLSDHGQVMVGNITDLHFLREALSGVDTIVHLAADASPTADWNSLLENNIIGTRNIFEMASTTGVRRVVFASSIHAVSGYPAQHQVQADDPVNPGDEYGVSKCFGEAMARYAAVQRGLSSICIRIGAFQPLEAARSRGGIRLTNIFVSDRDLNQLICRCIDDERLQFAILNGLSNNRFNRMDIETARELVGYEPKDDFTNLNTELAALRLGEQVKPQDELHTFGRRNQDPLASPMPDLSRPVPID